MKRKIASLLTLITAACICAMPALAADKVRMFRASNNFTLLQLFMTDAGGYFDKQNLDVEHIIGQGGSPGVAALMRGSFDIYVGSTVPVLLAQMQQAPLSVIGAVTTQFVTDIVVTKEWAAKQGVGPDSPLDKRLALMKGAVIGSMDHGGGSTQIIQYAAEHANLKLDRDMTITVLGSSATTMLAAMDQGRIHGFAMSAPASLTAIRDHGAMFLARPSIGELSALDGYLYINMTATKDWLAKNGDIAVRILTAEQQALNDYHNPATSDALREKTRLKWYPNVDADLFKEAWENNKYAAPKSVEVTAAQFKQIIDFENSFGTPKLDPAAANTAFDDTFAKKAVAAVGVWK